MSGSREDIDYSGLNKSLQPKKPIDSIRTNTAKAIWDVFLNWVNNKNTKQKRLDALSDQIKEWHENMKIKLILTIDYLSKEWLLKPKSIKSLSADKIKEIAWKNETWGGEYGETALEERDRRIKNIIKYLVDDWRKNDEKLTNEQKEKLNQAVMDWMNEHYWKLAEKEDRSEELKARNDELEEELNASEAANEVVESAVLKRRSRNNTIRVWKSIERINENKKWLDPVTKARKVIWQANSFAVFGSWKRFDLINKLPKKIDVNKEYKEVAHKLIEKMNTTEESREKVAIRYIMRQVNKAYKDYIDATNISEETRKQNMRDINMAMAA